MKVIKKYEDLIKCLRGVVDTRLGCELNHCYDEENKCHAISVHIYNKLDKKSLKFEGMVIAVVKEFFPFYDIFTIIKRSKHKIMIFYPEEICY